MLSPKTQKSYVLQSPLHPSPSLPTSPLLLHQPRVATASTSGISVRGFEFWVLGVGFRFQQLVRVITSEKLYKGDYCFCRYHHDDLPDASDDGAMHCCWS